MSQTSDIKQQYWYLIFGEKDSGRKNALYYLMGDDSLSVNHDYINSYVNQKIQLDNKQIINVIVFDSQCQDMKKFVEKPFNKIIFIYSSTNTIQTYIKGIEILNQYPEFKGKPVQLIYNSKKQQKDKELQQHLKQQLFYKQSSFPKNPIQIDLSSIEAREKSIKLLIQTIGQTAQIKNLWKEKIEKKIIVTSDQNQTKIIPDFTINPSEISQQDSNFSLKVTKKDILSTTISTINSQPILIENKKCSWCCTLI